MSAYPSIGYGAENLDLEALHFWPCEGSGNGKLQKDSPQRQLQREVSNRPKITPSLHFNKVLIDCEFSLQLPLRTIFFVVYHFRYPHMAENEMPQNQ